MRVVLTTAPSDVAPAMVETLVRERFVACGNIIPGVRSFYWWDGEVQDDTEVVVLMETADERVDAAVERLAKLHPYTVPKIMTLRPDAVNDAYRQWCRAETMGPRSER